MGSGAPGDPPQISDHFFPAIFPAFFLAFFSPAIFWQFFRAPETFFSRRGLAIFLLFFKRFFCAVFSKYSAF